MRKPPRRAGSKTPGDGDKAFVGGRAMERVRQFERARGLGPPIKAAAPDLPRGTVAAKRPARKAEDAAQGAAAKPAPRAGKSGKTGTTRKRRTAPSRRKGSTS